MRIKRLVNTGAAALALAACAAPTGPDDPARNGQTVAVINSLSWTNPLTGKRDGARSSWPLPDLAGHQEAFPLAQLRQCAGETCAWGVMKARRSVGAYRYVPGGLTLELVVEVDVDRRQQVDSAAFNTAMTIPADVAALRATRQVKRTVALQYGRIEHIDFDYGVGFDLCALRYDAAAKPLDRCDIPYI